MPLPVSAKNDLDGYILETTIAVKIPKGTEGELVQEIRKDLVIVQFDVPSLPPLRVSKKDLLMNDSIDAVVLEMKRILNIKPFVERDVHRAADNLLLRALETLSTEENEAQVKTIIHLYQKIHKHYQ
ncbi:MAG: hypothetical protein Phog2KO_41390 [Phototrophicaceae bacterium]